MRITYCKRCGRADDRRGSNSVEGPVCGTCIEQMRDEDDKQCWPIHVDGSRKRIKDMTSAERRQVFQRSATRVAAQFAEPDNDHCAVCGQAGIYGSACLPDGRTVPVCSGTCAERATVEFANDPQAQAKFLQSYERCEALIAECDRTDSRIRSPRSKHGEVESITVEGS